MSATLCAKITVFIKHPVILHITVKRYNTQSLACTRESELVAVTNIGESKQLISSGIYEYRPIRYCGILYV